MENDGDMLMSDEDDFSDTSIDVLGDDDLDDIEPSAAPGWFELHPAQYFMARTYGDNSAKTVDDHRSEQLIYGNRPVVNDGTHDSLKDPHIRLLKIRPAALGSLVHCDLIIRPLLDAPSYRAISYAWGDEDVTGIVYMGAKDISYKISQHLWEALNRLRDESVPVYVWIDALCINQQHFLDKSTQVQIMAQIYDQAEEVRVWLGNIDTLDFNHISDLELFWTLCRNDNPWWTRLWIVQECAYARQCPVVMIGAHTMTLEDMVKRWSAVTLSIHSLPYEEQRRQILITNLDLLRMPYGAWQMQVEEAKHRLPLLTRLRMTAGRRYTVPHDRIYALLNLVDEAEARQIPPDYGKSYDALQGEVQELLKKSLHWHAPTDADLLAHPLPPDVKPVSETADRIHASLIHAATKRDDIDALQDLLRIKYARNREHYGPALCMACEHGHVEMATILLDQIKDTLDVKQDVDHEASESDGQDESDTRNDPGYNFLEAAARNGREEIFDLILASGISFRRDFYTAALDQAAKNGHLSIVLKLRTRPNVDVSNAATLAIRAGHEETAKLLLTADGGCGLEPALLDAAKHNRLELTTWLLDNGADVNSDKYPNRQSPLYEAAQSGHIAMVKLLLNRGASLGFDIVKRRRDPIKAASSGGHMDVLKVLLEQAAVIDWAAATKQYDPEQKHRPVAQEDVTDLSYLLSNAVAFGQLAAVKYLLGKGADPNSRVKHLGLSDLYIACAANNPGIAQALLEAGADVDAWFQSPTGHLLHHVCHYGYDEVVKILLAHGSDPNQREDSAHPYALHSAAANGHTEIVKMLIEGGAEPNAEGGWYGSALQAAVTNLHPDTAEELLERGADIGLEGGTYGSALQAAVAKNNHNMFDLLLAFGAEVKIDSKLGTEGSAIEIAASRGFSGILSKLLSCVGPSDKQQAYAIAIAAAIRGDHADVVKLIIEDDDKEAKLAAAGDDVRQD